MALRRGKTMLRQWEETHPPDKATDVKTRGWLHMATLPERGMAIAYEIESWLQDRSLPTPDLVRCIALYGKTRLMLQHWKLPIDVREEDFPRWREQKYRMTSDDFMKRLAGLAGGFLKLAGQDTRLIVDTIQQQLDERLTEMEDLANQQLDWYTPRKFTPDESLDGDELMQDKAFERVFDLREELICFEWGMEKFRIFAMSEQNPKVNLPNVELYRGFMEINLNLLLARLHAVDPQLKKILRHLAKHDYYKIDTAYMPDIFWWRHWKEETKRQREECRSQ